MATREAEGGTLSRVVAGERVVLLSGSPGEARAALAAIARGIGDAACVDGAGAGATPDRGLAWTALATLLTMVVALAVVHGASGMADGAGDAAGTMAPAVAGQGGHAGPR